MNPVKAFPGFAEGSGSLLANTKNLRKRNQNIAKRVVGPINLKFIEIHLNNLKDFPLIKNSLA